MMRSSSLSTLSLLPLLLALATAQVYPDVRFTEWDLLSDADKASGTTLGYTLETWNQPGSNAIEALSYFTIGQTNEQQIAAIGGLGMDEVSWDCFIK